LVIGFAITDLHKGNIFIEYTFFSALEHWLNREDMRYCCGNVGFQRRLAWGKFTNVSDHIPNLMKETVTPSAIPYISTRLNGLYILEDSNYSLH